MKHAAQWAGAGLIAFWACGPAHAQTTERVSVDSSGNQSNAHSWWQSSISTDGRFVAFVSDAANLVAGDTNGVGDVFVRDRLNGATVRVSLGTAGLQWTTSSDSPAISADGRFVAYVTHPAGAAVVYLRDRQNATTELVSVSYSGAAADGWSPSISADGRFVAFGSWASDILQYYDSDMWSDIYVRDRQTGTTKQVSPDFFGPEVDGDCFNPAISGDGRFVAFDTDGPGLLPQGVDSNGALDIYVHDRQAGTTERVSVATGGAQTSPWGAGSRCASVSGDGRFVAFESDANNLVPGAAGNLIYVRDRLNGTTELVSSNAAGVPGAANWFSSISADGRFVAFESSATNLVPGDTNGVYDAFVKDRRSGFTERVSVATGWGEANGASKTWGSLSSVSGDGRFVVYMSTATNLVVGDTNGFYDIFVRDRGVSPSVFCFGDGSTGACPCANNGASGKGCENSVSTGGAVLASAGSASISGDTLLLTTAGDLPNAASVVLQGDSAISPIPFGDGLRCTGGALKRMYTKTASAGVVNAPQPGDASFSARSALLGDLIASGSTRYYQTYYRDLVSSFCASPTGNLWNASSGLSILWGP